MAYSEHEKVCNEWRKQGLPSLSTHPAKIAKVFSKRNLQKITLIKEALTAQRHYVELMDSFNNDINKIYNKLKKIRGDNVNKVYIPIIETLNPIPHGGRFSIHSTGGGQFDPHLFNSF